jgi:glycosyltransferase involved in cell wall biosynthesis
MRIAQIIDSLEAGGAERMAVNYANALTEKIDFSGLVVTRKEGPLSGSLKDNCSYLFLAKKSTFDFYSVFKLKSYVVKNNIEIVHAHGTSFFTAILLKLIYPQIKIVWHEHYGARVIQPSNKNLVLKICSFFFSSVFVVSRELETWAKDELFCKKVFYIANFASDNPTQLESTLLKGIEGKRILCLANLKHPKNHLELLSSFYELELYKAGWSLHFVGEDYQDEYSRKIKEFINSNLLSNSVFSYGVKNDIKNILSQGTIGVLVSTSEGFPVCLLEYGLAGLPTLSTNVGSCPDIIIDNKTGLLFDPKIQNDLKIQLNKIISDKSMRDQFGVHLQELVQARFAKEKIVTLLISQYELVST